jgi:hypothetical protein
MSLVDEVVELFKSIGLDKQKSEEASKNAKLSTMLRDLIREANCGKGCDKLYGQLLYYTATRLPSQLQSYRDLIARYIGNGKFYKIQQIDSAMEYLKKSHEKINIEGYGSGDSNYEGGYFG